VATKQTLDWLMAENLYLKSEVQALKDASFKAAQAAHSAAQPQAPATPPAPAPVELPWSEPASLGQAIVMQGMVDRAERKVNDRPAFSDMSQAMGLPSRRPRLFGR
jgi:hypothetical protein